MTSRGRDLPALGVALAAWMVVAAWLWAGPHAALLTWDEVDYLTAARMGPAANALDAGGLGLGGLLEMVRAKSRGVAPELPPGYEEGSDPVVVRHYHPPGMVYPHLPLAHARDERILRLPLLGGLLLFLSLFCVAAGRLMPLVRPWQWGVIGLAGGWLGLVGFTLIQGHGWLATWTLALALGLAAWRGSGWSRGRALTLGGLVAAALTLESAVVLWVVVAAFLAFHGPRRGVSRLDVAATFGLAVAGVCLLWPGAVVNASPLHIVALYAYRIGWGEEYTGMGSRLVRSLVPYLPLLGLAAVSLAARLAGGGAPRGKRGSDAGLPPADARLEDALMVLSGAYGGAMLLVAMAPTYLLPAAAPALLLALSSVFRRAGRLAGATGAAFALAVAGLLAWPSQAATDAQARAELALIGQAGEGRMVWADGGHILRWYHPELSIRDLTVSWDGATLTRRVDGAYLPVGAEAVEGALVVIVAWRDAHPLTPAALSGCRRTPLRTVSLFDC